jgi:hypothetical protein
VDVDAAGAGVADGVGDRLQRDGVGRGANRPGQLVQRLGGMDADLRPAPAAAREPRQGSDQVIGLQRQRSQPVDDSLHLGDRIAHLGAKLADVAPRRLRVALDHRVQGPEAQPDAREQRTQPVVHVLAQPPALVGDDAERRPARDGRARLGLQDRDGGGHQRDSSSAIGRATASRGDPDLFSGDP